MTIAYNIYFHITTHYFFIENSVISGNKNSATKVRIYSDFL